MLIASLYACSLDPADPADPDSPTATPVDTQVDTAADTSIDTSVDTSVDTGADSDSAVIDTSIVVLSSEDAASAGACASTTPICSGGSCALRADLATVTVAGALSGLPDGDWALRLSDPRVAIDSYNPVRDDGLGTYTPFGSQVAWVAGGTYTMQALTGTWDLAIDEGAPGEGPDSHFPIAAGVTLERDTTLDVDPGFRTVSGSIAVGGELFPDGCQLRFEDPATGAYATVRGRGGSFELPLVDGTWSVWFTPDESDTLAEGTYEAGTVVVSGDTALVLDVEVWPVTGTLLVDGHELEELGPESWWRLTFTDEAGGEWVQPLHGGTEVFSTRLPAGTWQARVDGWCVVGTDLVVSGATSFDLANEELTLEGSTTIDGSPAGEEWSFELDDLATNVGYTVSGPTWSQQVHPGSYTVYASRNSAEQVGRSLVAGGVPIVTGGVFDLAVDMATITGTATWDGAPLESGWRVLFIDQTGEHMGVFPTSVVWTTTLPVGTYDVYVENRRVSGEPFIAVARGFALTGDVELALEVVTRALSVEVYVNGVATDGGALYWHDEASGDTTYEDFMASEKPWAAGLGAGAYTLVGSPASPDLGETVAVPALALCVEIGPS